MLQPITDIARTFNTQCISLSESLRGPEAALSSGDRVDRISQAIRNFFEAIQQLPLAIAPLEGRATVLFEIDCVLVGLYGTSLFSAVDTQTPVRILLRDLAALWQRYYLIAGLERSEASGNKIAGTMSFYHNWVQEEKVGSLHTEYDCLLKDVSLLLKEDETLNLEAKVLLFSLMGKILITLGVSEDFAVGRLTVHNEVVKTRRIASREELSEILLCLQIMQVRGKGIESTGIESEALQKAIRYWSSKDNFLNTLFQTWGWHWEYDVTKPLVMGDKIELADKSRLYTAFAEQTAVLGIGHSYLDLENHKRKNPGLTTVFQPVPIFMFGDAGVGKTSLLLGFCYSVQMRAGRTVALGRELQAFYDASAAKWRMNDLNSTTISQSFTFWEDLNVVSYTIFEYRGKEAQPDQWEEEVQERFRNAKGLFFLIDAQEFSDPARLRMKSGWFNAILQLWLQSNPHIQHAPVGLIVTKSDLLLGSDIGAVPATSLVPSCMTAGLLDGDVFFRHLYPRQTDQLTTALGRLREYVLHDRKNNATPELQDLAQLLLENLSQFFSRVLDTTYNFQIFLTASLPPQGPSGGVFPWGVREPFQWMMQILTQFHIRESISKFRIEEKQIEEDMGAIREDLGEINLKLGQIVNCDAEKRRILEKGSLFHALNRDKLKFLEENKQLAEQEIMSLAKRYIGDITPQNKNAVKREVEKALEGKERLLQEIRKRRMDYENRKRVGDSGSQELVRPAP